MGHEEQRKIEVRNNKLYFGACNEKQALAAWHKEARELFSPIRQKEREHKEELRALNNELREAIKTLAPDLYSRATTISEMIRRPYRPDIDDKARLQRAQYLSHILDFPWVGNTPVPPPPSGEFWWAHTESSFNDDGLNAQTESDGLHFFGNINYGGDSLIHRNIGATATFVLDPARRPASPSGRWRSQPWVELFGRIDGWTGVYHWLWAADDKWCKCKLFLRQTALQFVPDLVILATNTELRTLIDEENQGRNTHADLPGFLPMPIIEFGVADPNQSVIVDLEVRFDIELEGDSFIGFSPQPNPFQSVLLRHFQWKVGIV